MKLQLPTLIIVFLSIALILLIHFLGDNNTLSSKESIQESGEFQIIQSDADYAFNGRDFTQAIQLYEQALELRPDNAEICNDLGATHYELALKYAGPDWPSWEKELTGESIEDAHAELKLAMQKTESGYIVFKTSSAEVANAITEKAKAEGAEVFPYGKTPTTLNILIGPTKDHLLQAHSLYKKSVELKSTYDAPYRNLGSLYMKIGIRDKAINYFYEAYRREPGDLELAEYIQQFRQEGSY